MKEINFYQKREDIREKEQKISKPKELVWNVINATWQGEVGYVNVFDYNWPFRAYIYDTYKAHKDDFNEFAKGVYSAIQHEYWARCEYEVVVSEFPTRLEEPEIQRMAQEVEQDKQDNPTRARHFVYPNIPGAVKIDISDQILMNWDAFISYLWENRKLISHFRSDYLRKKEILAIYRSKKRSNE